MKKIVNFSMAALVVMGTILAGCAKNEVAEPETKDNIVIVTTTVGLGENNATKALDIDYVNEKVTKTFGAGEQIAVVYKNTSDQLVKAVATAENISGDGKSASFTFTLVNPRADQTVFYYYPAALVTESGSLDIPIATQDGTLSNVESLDYAYNTGYMSGTTLPASVTLENKFAIVAFTLKDANGANDITSTITGMTISEGANTYDITRSAAAGPIYVIMRPTDDATIEITATDGSKSYTKTLTGKTWAANNFYQQGLRMTDSTPLTVEALTAGTVNVTITDYYGPATLSSGMKYSKNGGEKTLITTSTDIPVSAGDKVQFYGNGTSTQAYGSYPEVKIQGSGTGFTCKAYGNIMSLLDEGNYATKTNLPNVPRVFSGLFEDNTALTDAGDLLLPVTTLTTLCYEEMFNGCTALTTAPELPATTLASNCYYQMFGYCSALTTAPSLPAETLASDCYTNMFFRCTALTTAPELPAEVLAGSCYYQMFYGCTALTTAPDLLAPALVQNCYYGMFRYCTNLNSLRCLATSGINENSSTEYWLEGAAAAGTFHLAGEARTAWCEGDGGIPSGWTGLYPDGSSWCLPHLLANVKAKDAGMLVGANGYIYDSNTSVAIAGTTAVAMIAYVGSETDNATYKHGLAIALTDDKGTGWETMGWSTAMSTCTGKTAVSGGQWQLPSLNQWKTMFVANGGDDHSYTGLNTTITSAGGAALSADQKYYWTSTTEDAEHAWAWGYNMYGIMEYNNVMKNYLSYHVRACLVF